MHSFSEKILSFNISQANQSLQVFLASTSLGFPKLGIDVKDLQIIPALSVNLQFPRHFIGLKKN